MNKGYDFEDVQDALVQAMKRGYTVHYENVEGGTAVRLMA